MELLRPARKGETERAGTHLFKPLWRQEPGRVAVRILCRVLGLTTAIWHDDKAESRSSGH